MPPQHGQCQNTKQLQRDPNAMNVDMARDCQRQLDVRGMTYDQMAEYFEEMKAAAKDREELAKKKDFPDAAQ